MHSNVMFADRLLDLNKEIIQYLSLCDEITQRELLGFFFCEIL
jgi:hypothetical protein